MDVCIAVLPGDGIGPEVIAEGVRVLEAVGQRFGHTVKLRYADAGGIAIDKHGSPLPDQALDLCLGSDAVLFGSVGGPKWDASRSSVRPEQGLLKLRQSLKLFANLRPVYVFPCMVEMSPLKGSVLQGTDLLVVRELTGGIYFGKPRRRWETSRGRRAVDTLTYSEAEIERILRVGFELARNRRKRLTSVDKANVLDTSRLWREMANEMAEEYPDVSLDHMYVDNCAMQLVLNPSRFDVLVTENMFGDILSDESGVLAGSLGMLPSASLARVPGLGGRRRRRVLGLYEPIHGSAPDIAGQGKANPYAAILTVALMLRYSLALEQEARAVEVAVEQAVEGGYRTPDLAGGDGSRPVATSEVGKAVVGFLTG